MIQPRTPVSADANAPVSPSRRSGVRKALFGAAAALAVLVVVTAIKLWPRDETTDSNAMCWGALSRAQARPLLVTEEPVSATETGAQEQEAMCDVRSGKDVADIQFQLSLRDGTANSVTPPRGTERLTGSRAGWVTQAGGRLRLSASCVDALHRTTASRVDLLLLTTIQVRKHYGWKSSALVPRVRQVLTEAARGMERHYKCAS
ncbi:hypothetical protein ACIRU3_40665 [Streptomyces sp. NPDC101151]|uniref:hypothetical protein n=1 Tax=Streptomyces sp. NPDC101151 TaxID=3366115 RepID=UPI0037FB21F6